eukprot:TRINITY_DN58317_c0_g1_i1.p1 TRINITY_DN58317_c0_g1~~TRINITY_DN58317_c0_g1_i1.p1  ORF type:complete len:288 (+),score=34.34 TRINITY_DN58317_c0_g1_i1:111-866(+)
MLLTEAQITRPRAGRRTLWPALATVAIALLTVSLSLCTRDENGESAFVSPVTARSRAESPIAMRGGSRRQNKYYQPKKTHIKFLEKRKREYLRMTPHWGAQLAFMGEAYLPDWSHTLKLTFPEGEDDVVTEDEVREYFTTDEYAPEAVIVGHQMPHENAKHTYVHFSCNEHAKKARKEKNGGSIGKASEIKCVFTLEKKWIRLRDGVSLAGGFWGKRARWMKAYGDEAYPGWAHDEEPLRTGVRRHWYYPE